MKIIVTGGAGFIGSHILDRLITLGHNVAVIDTLAFGNRSYIGKTKFYNADIRNLEQIIQVFKKFRPEAVFHLAAQTLVSYSLTFPQVDQQTNILGMMNLLQASSKVGVKKFVYSNTAACYGDLPKKELPIKEDTTLLKPTSFYGVSKLSAELYLRLYGSLFNLNWISLRYANVYGPRQSGDREGGITAIFTKKLLSGKRPIIYGDGTNTRDYIYIDDVVNANLLALEYPQSDYFNISTGLQVSNLEVFKIIESILKTGIVPKYQKARKGDLLYSSLDPDKARRKLKWKARVSFKEGISKTIDYFKEVPKE